MRRAALATLLLIPPAAAAGDRMDARRISVEIAVRADSLAGKVRIEAAAEGAPASWTLDLVPEMEVRGASVDGKPLSLDRRGGSLVLDLAGSGAASSGDHAFEFAIDGRPSEVFPKERGGYVRSAVGPDLAYVRSQVAWYPRPSGDAAAWKAIVDAPKGWHVRTAGTAPPARVAGDRALWTFTEEHPLEEAGFVAGPWRHVEARAAGGSALDALVFPGHEKGAGILLETARRALEHYAGRFGALSTGGRFSLVEMPDAFGKGSGYGESGYALIGSGAFEDAGEAPWAEAHVAHEVSHSWWGREVGFTTFAGESLATYATFGFVEADRGPEAAAAERRKAVDAVAKAAAAGKSVAFSDIRPHGRGMDPETYRVHAYEKGAMLLTMVEDAVGRREMDRALSAFFAASRGKRVDWPDLRAALYAALGGGVPRLLEQGEAPGLPTLTLQSTSGAVPGARKWWVKGTIAQAGTSGPWFLPRIGLQAVGDGKGFRFGTALEGPTADFSCGLPFAPEFVVADPEARLLAVVRVAGAPDPKEAVDRCFQVLNSAGQSDPEALGAIAADLRRVLAAGAGEIEAVCRTGLGRCLFRLEKRPEAKAELEKALELGAGGPFHRAWCRLRLGCLADLEGRRKEAVAHYEKARGPGASKTVVGMAGRFLEKPYRGFATDG